MTPVKILTSNKYWLALAVVLVFSLVIRIAIVGHGLPYLQVVDENSDLSTALQLSEGEIPTPDVRYHRSLIAYVNAASVGGLFGYTFLTGEARSLAEFRDLYFSDRASFTLATRLTFVILTTFTVLMVALIGSYLNRWVSILSATALALNAFYTQNSVYALPDALAMVTVALFLWMTMRAWKYRRGRDYFLAGVSLGLVMLSKFSASGVAVSMVIAHIAVAWDTDDTRRFLHRLILSRRVVYFVLGVVVGNVVVNPLAFLYPADLLWEINRLGNYAMGSAPGSLDARLQVMLSRIVDITRLGWRWLLPASAVGLLALVLHRRSPPYWMIVGSFFVLLLTISNVTTVYYKVFYWTPWIIPMVLLSGIGLDALRQVLTARKLPGLAYALILALFAAESVFLFHTARIMTAPNTRHLALEYIQSRWQPGTRLLSGEPLVYAVPVQRNARSIERARELNAPNLKVWDWWLSLPDAGRPSPGYDLYGPEMQTVIQTFDDVDRLIRSENIPYLIEADYCTGSQNRPDSDSDEEFPAVSADMRAGWALVAVFSPFKADACAAPIDTRTGLALHDLAAFYNQVRPGPLVRIYRTLPGG